MRKHYYFAKTLAILSLLIMTLTTLFYCAPKVISTAAKMAVLNDNIQYYNEQYRKTDEMTEEVQKYFDARNEYYNSQDTLVHWFANLNSLFKMLVSVVAIASYPMFLYMWTVLIATRVRRMRRAKVREQQQRRKVA